MVSHKTPKEILTRTISALILAPLVMFIIYLGGNFFTALILFACIVMSLEWSKLVRNDVSNNYSKIDKTIWNVFGFMYVVIPSVCLVYIRDLEHGLTVMLWLVLSVWATDIGAYFVGTTLKGPKIFPKISPKKSWSGLVGGMISAGCVGYYFHLQTPMYHINFYIMSFAIALVSQIGDFIESAIKRNFKVKDSGNLIPGHGGLMDRLDGLITASVFVAYLELMAGL